MIGGPRRQRSPVRHHRVRAGERDRWNPVWLGNHNGECAPATVRGRVKVSSSVGQVTIDGATVAGPLVLQDNTGSTIVSGNHISGPLSCTGNSPAPKSGQCAGL